MNESKVSNRRWALVGRIATILGIVWLVVQIGGRVWKPDAIAATGVSTDMMLPPQVADFVRATGFDLKSQLYSARSPFHEEDPTPGDTAAMANKSAILDEMGRANSAARIQLTNESSRELTDLAVEVRGTGLFSITTIAGAQNGTYQGTVPLGSLRPGSSLEVILWSSTIEPYLREARITSPEGAVPVRFSEPVRGILAWVVSNAFYFTVGSMLAISVVLLVVSTSSLHPTASPDQQEPPPGTNVTQP